MFATDVQVVDAITAHALHQDAVRKHALVAWIVWEEHPAHPEHRFIAQLATASPLPYIVVGETLAEVQSQLPLGLVRSGRQPADAPEVVEIWA